MDITLIEPEFLIHHDAPVSHGYCLKYGWIKGQGNIHCTSFSLAIKRTEGRTNILTDWQIDRHENHIKSIKREIKRRTDRQTTSPYNERTNPIMQCRTVTILALKWTMRSTQLNCASENLLICISKPLLLNCLSTMTENIFLMVSVLNESLEVMLKCGVISFVPPPGGPCQTLATDQQALVLMCPSCQ